MYLEESHTSLLGLRDLAHQAGVSVCSMPWARFKTDGSLASSKPNLVAFPAQCNATGQRFYSPDLMRKLRDSHPGSYILLDAASFLSSSQYLDLSALPYDTAPDYIAFSLYKIFGYPTGLGGLLVKRCSATALTAGKVYHGGGTLEAVTARRHWKVPKQGVCGSLEDGTINFQAILAIPHAIRVFDRLFGKDIACRGEYLRALTQKLFVGLEQISHSNGQRVTQLYTKSETAHAWRHGDPSEANDQGPVIAFNVLQPDGQPISPLEVDRLACIQNIHLRSGRHCNAGFVSHHVLENDEQSGEEMMMKQHQNGVACEEVAGADGQVTASVRVSLGIYNTNQDVQQFLEFIAKFFCHHVATDRLESGKYQNVHADYSTRTVECNLARVTLYPIKSCHGQQLSYGEPWPITPHGLEFDREWMIVDTRNGKPLSQKRYPAMTRIQPRMDRSRQCLIVDVEGVTEEVSLFETGECKPNGHHSACGTSPSRTSKEYRTINVLLSRFFGFGCELVRQDAGTRFSKLDNSETERVPLLLSNESPFLLLNQQSVDTVSQWIAQDHPNCIPSPQAEASSFRGNFLLDSSGNESSHPVAPIKAFEEDQLHQLYIGPHTFIPLGPCRRCQMVSIDQDTGAKAPETFLAIARKRRSCKGRILFGTHLMLRTDPAVIKSVGLGDSTAQQEDEWVWAGMKVTMVLKTPVTCG